jgi:hypothetical protein
MAESDGAPSGLPHRYPIGICSPATSLAANFGTSYQSAGLLGLGPLRLGIVHLTGPRMLRHQTPYIARLRLPSLDGLLESSAQLQNI